MPTQEELERGLAAIEAGLAEDGADIARGLGALATLRGDFDKALTYYERATEFNPNDAGAREGVARTKRLIAQAGATPDKE